METIESNKLIAEFMGLEQWNESYYKHPNIFYSHYKESPTQVHFENLQYNLSWDWLMPVIGKISDLCQEPQELDNLKYCLLSADIETANYQVVEFIKEYNKQN